MLPARLTGHRLVVKLARKKARAVLEAEAAKGYKRGWQILRSQLSSVRAKVAKAEYGELLSPEVLNRMEAAIQDGLSSGTRAASVILAKGEGEWFANAGHEVDEVRAEHIYDRYVQNFEREVPGGFKGVSATVRDAVHRETMAWASDPANPGQPALETSLGRWFAPSRSALIATTEGTRLCTAESQIIGERLGSTQGEWDDSNDDVVCSVCAGLAEASPYNIDGQEPQPPDASHPGCVLPGQFVSVPGLTGATRCRYEGLAVEICLRSGRRLAVTKDHAVLTRAGWRIAQLIKQGDEVIYCSDPERLVGPDDDEMPAMIEQVFDALALSRGMTRCRVPSAAEQLDREWWAEHREVDVVNALGSLEDERAVGNRLPQTFSQPAFLVGRAQSKSLDSSSSLRPFFSGAGAAPGSLVCSSGQPLPLSLGSLSHAGIHPARAVADRNALLLEPVTQDESRYAGPLRALLQRYPANVGFDEVCEIRHFRYVGHVYDLQSEPWHMFACNGIIIHNCRCEWVVIPAGFEDEDVAANPPASDGVDPVIGAGEPLAEAD
jgi:hypothetical protein